MFINSQKFTYSLIHYENDSGSIKLEKLDSKNHMRALLYGFHFLNVDVPIMFLADARSDWRIYYEH